MTLRSVLSPGDARHTVVNVVLLSVLSSVVYVLLKALYNAFFHPLARYPGPRLWAATRIPYTRMYLSGEPHLRILELHKKYGPVVRIAPDTLVYSHPDAWKEVRGHRKHGADEHGKDPGFQVMNRGNIIGADRENHARFRRAMSHGFSAQAMLDQQPIIKAYIDELFDKLREHGGSGRPVDIVAWYNYTTFDIIGDLAFGEPFGCLRTTTYHPWVSMIFNSIKNMAFITSLRRYPALSAPLQLLIPREVRAKLAQHNQLSRERVRKRLALPTARPDFVDSMSTKHGNDQPLSFDDIVANSAILIIAGSETTATLLSAATYFLLANPDTLKKLTHEVRSSFASEDEIDMVSVSKLAYLLAVLDESLRMYPPAPAGAPRRIAPGGDIILGQFVPAGTIVEIWHYATYHNSAHFTLPDSFIPERWLNDPRFESDKREAFQPFSVGPRNCIGRNLAYSEMRLILARMVWNYDLKLAPDSVGWSEKSRIYILWEKEPLNVYLTPPRKPDKDA